MLNMVKNMFKKDPVRYCSGCSQIGKCMMYGYGVKYGSVVLSCTGKLK